MSQATHCGCSKAQPAGEMDHQYAAKLVCGVLPPEKEPRGANPLAAGQYFTAVNVHNPSRCEAAEFRWKVAAGKSLEAREFRVSGFAPARLGPDEALEIDCRDAMQLLAAAGNPGAFVEGWIVIESEADLDVVAVYTSASSPGALVNTFHTERVQARCVPRCEDLVADLSTGVAAWEFRRHADKTFSAPTLGKGSPSWADLGGAQWLRPANAEGSTEYVYQFCFDLCTGFENPTLELQVLADNHARVELNGTPLAGPNYVPAGTNPHLYHTAKGANAFKTPGTATAAPNQFRAGRNCLTVIVANEGGPSGLALHGTLEVERGRCPGSTPGRLRCPGVSYRVHAANHIFESDHGWLGWVTGGQTAGTTGQHRRVEAVEIVLNGAAPGTTIQYRAHLKNSGWTGWTPEGQTCGTTGEGRRMEAIEIQLVNKPVNCRLRYRVHMRGLGWGPWAGEGQQAGTTGQNRRIEAIEIVIE
ncbi:MAG: hypothetical protein FJW30_27390 [Acidobacteria bacterium]|nr:hypothetical protein [Acidobacteriota bacterium]